MMLAEPEYLGELVTRPSHESERRRKTPPAGPTYLPEFGGFQDRTWFRNLASSVEECRVGGLVDLVDSGLHALNATGIQCHT